MGRETTASKLPLLNNQEQNIGNSAIINPAPAGVTVIPATNPPRIINLEGGSGVGQTMSVIMTARRLNSNQNPNPGFPGPLTGVLEFGNGGRSTRMEFDMTVGPFIGSFEVVAQATEPQDGVTIVSVPTGVLRAYVRYDNQLLSPVVGTNQCLAQLRGVDLVGPGGPRNFSGPPPYSIPAEPVMAQAMAAYFTRHYSKATKTNYLYCSNPAPATLLILLGVPGAKADFFCLPAYTQNVKVMRLPLTSAIEVFLFNGIQIVDQLTIAAGTSAPIIPIPTSVNMIGFRSLTNADTVSFLAIACEVGI